MDKGTVVVCVLLSFLAGTGLMWGIAQNAKMSPSAELDRSGPGESHAASPIAVYPDDPVWGKADAPVTLVEVSDFECPYCARVIPAVARVQKEYGGDKVRLVWKHNPMSSHRNARPAAEAAATVQGLGGDFWKYVELLFQNQKSLGAEKFRAWATEVGVDARSFQTAFDEKKYAAKVDKDLAWAERVGARGTPNFFINGKLIRGAQPFETFKAAIDEQIAAAEALARAGMARGKLSLELTKKNYQRPEEAKPQREAGSAPVEDSTIWKMPVLDDDPVRGAADARVTIVEFSDFQCPYCSRVEATLQKLLDEYQGDLRVVWKDAPMPFHPRARPAAYLARFAHARGGSPSFWAAHEALFASQSNLEEAGLEAISQKLGLRWDQVKAALGDSEYRAKVDESADLAADFRVTKTPHFFINGRRLVGAQPYEKFKELVEAGLADARRLSDQGVSRGKIFRELMKTAQPPPEPEKKQVPLPGKDSPFKGAPNAKIVIQEFSDFQCPFCSRVNVTITEILKEHPADVKLVWRHMPASFHADAALASEAAQEAFEQAGNPGFWKYHDKLFENQRALGRADLEKYAGELGLDLERFRVALDTRKHQARVESDAALGQKAAMGGTPGFVINGYFVSGAQPLPVFEKAIRLALKGG
jgi:protein-disulfide isomerase